MAKWILRLVALAYLLFLLILPIGLIGWRTFADGVQPVIDSLTSEEALHAMRVTVEVAIWAVVLNTVFGVGAAVLLVRRNFPGKRLLSALIDLPLAVSPVVVGLALILAYGKYSTVGGWLESAGIQVIFSIPGMVLATVFVSLPLVVRAIVPVLEEMGDDQEQAARTLGAGSWATFRRITVPGIRGALGYGIVLCLARALGEYGAVAVVSGKVVGETQTLTLFVEERYLNYEVPTAFAAASLLALVAVATLLITRVLRAPRWREEPAAIPAPRRGPAPAGPAARADISRWREEPAAIPAPRRGAAQAGPAARADISRWREEPAATPAPRRGPAPAGPAARADNTEGN